MNDTPTILVVDDEIEIVDLMRDFLEAEGYRVVAAHDGDEALAVLERTPVDCLLLDVMMPGKSGFDVCRQIRERTDLPVLFLSARQGDTDKIRGLGLGADDYIVKSATPGETVARIKAVLRRYRRGASSGGASDTGDGTSAGTGPGGGSTIPSTLDFGRLVLDVRAHEVRVDGRPVPFTAKEFDLLRLLAEHPRQVFTREQLFERVWGDFGDLHTVTVHTARIREKIEADPGRPQYIVTVWGVGYRFEGGRRR